MTPSACILALSAGFPTITVFIIALVLVIAGVFIWAAFVREPGQHHSHRHRKHHWRQPKPEKDDEADEHRKRGLFGSGKRRRRRKNRPVNPTLAETGGLPPKRADDGGAR